MDNAELERFVDYYRNNYTGYYVDVIDHLYEKFGREFIFDLPVEKKPYRLEQQYTVIRGTAWIHSTTGPAGSYAQPPGFFILGHYMTLDQWLPYSALSPEEQLLYKLKYG
jgi:hypothetical protein